MNNKIALITGVTGQDGSYLAEFLIDKGYEVHGVKRRTSLFNTNRIDHLIESEISNKIPFYIHHGDLIDSESLINLIQKIKPDEIYNLAAQSHVSVSFEQPIFTADTNALGTLRILEAIRILGLQRKTKLYQASTSELYGKVKEVPQSENTPFYPRSPYGVSKLFAYWITVNYREAYDIFACNGILFNHESPRRGETFVTRKISRALCRIKLGLQDCLYVGNLNARRDWGHARDYVEMQWLMLQQDEPKDYVIASGINYSVKDFINCCCNFLDISIKWSGSGLNEIAVNEKNKNTFVKINPRYFRPTEVDTLLGDATKARNLLGWKPKISFDELVKEMVDHDLKEAKLEKIKIDHGFN